VTAAADRAEVSVARAHVAVEVERAAAVLAAAEVLEAEAVQAVTLRNAII
jgi:hypothetical protein